MVVSVKFVSCKRIISSLYDFKRVSVLCALGLLFKPLMFRVAILILLILESV